MAAGSARDDARGIGAVQVSTGMNHAAIDAVELEITRNTVCMMRAGPFQITARRRVTRLRRLIPGAIVLAVTPGVAAASDYQAHASILDTAREFVTARIDAIDVAQAEVDVGQLDSRLHLRQCSKPLEAFLPTGSRELGRFTVGVKCTDANPWSLYVPVTVSVYKPIVVAADTLARGTVLGAADLRLERTDVAALQRDYFEDISTTSGMKLKRRIAAGEPLTASMVEHPRLIERGQQVTILATSAGMVVRTAGKALDHGAVGDRIGVINLSSEKKLEGVVTPDGEIRVDI